MQKISFDPFLFALGPQAISFHAALLCCRCCTILFLLTGNRAPSVPSAGICPMGLGSEWFLYRGWFHRGVDTLWRWFTAVVAISGACCLIALSAMLLRRHKKLQWPIPALPMRGRSDKMAI